MKTMQFASLNNAIKINTESGLLVIWLIKIFILHFLNQKIFWASKYPAPLKFKWSIQRTTVSKNVEIRLLQFFGILVDW